MEIYGNCSNALQVYEHFAVLALQDIIVKISYLLTVCFYHSFICSMLKDLSYTGKMIHAFLA